MTCATKHIKKTKRRVESVQEGCESMQKKRPVNITLFVEDVVWESKGGICLGKRARVKRKEGRYVDKRLPRRLNRIMFVVWILNEIVYARRKCVGYWRKRMRGWEAFEELWNRRKNVETVQAV